MSGNDQRPFEGFEWDPRKAASNARKHGVRFEEAMSVFDDEQSLAVFDEDHSDREDRWIIIGRSSRHRLLTVSYAEREETIRIITARRSTKDEQEQYGSNIH